MWSVLLSLFVVAYLPGAMIFITSMCFNLMSDGLRQAMDVRL